MTYSAINHYLESHCLVFGKHSDNQGVLAVLCAEEQIQAVNALAATGRGKVVAYAFENGLDMADDVPAAFGCSMEDALEQLSAKIARLDAGDRSFVDAPDCFSAHNEPVYSPRTAIAALLKAIAITDNYNDSWKVEFDKMAAQARAEGGAYRL